MDLIKSLELIIKYIKKPPNKLLGGKNKFKKMIDKF